MSQPCPHSARPAAGAQEEREEAGSHFLPSYPCSRQPKLFVFRAAGSASAPGKDRFRAHLCLRTTAAPTSATAQRLCVRAGGNKKLHNKNKQTNSKENPKQKTTKVEHAPVTAAGDRRAEGGKETPH